MRCMAGFPIVDLAIQGCGDGVLSDTIRAGYAYDLVVWAASEVSDKQAFLYVVVQRGVDEYTRGNWTIIAATARFHMDLCILLRTCR